MTSSAKRENPSAQLNQKHSPSKKLKKSTDNNDANSFDAHQILRVVLNPADCDLAFNIEGDGLTGHPLHEQGFAYYWSGARGNVGITRGKYCFGCKIVSNQPVEMEDTLPDQRNICRIGISRGNDPVGNLGETEHSYGFGGTGKISNDGKFVDYGERFGVGDTIVCLVDLESKPGGSIEFCKNGIRLGVAKNLDTGSKGLGLVDSEARKLPWESALFPHVSLKNTVVEMQFDLKDGLVPVEGYEPWASALKDEKALRGPSLSEPTDCEVIMMVGLPASGKSTWAEKWVKEHPEKRYVVLGTNLALDQMKVPGLLRKHNYGERFDQLMDRATGIFETLLKRASKVPRNYILDQTNVYKGPRKRKLKPFAIFRKIAVVVFPRAEELKLRAQKRFKEMGKEVPSEVVNEMLVNFVLPMSKDMRGTYECFDQIIFTELDRSEAQKHLNEMKRDLALSCGDKSAVSDRSIQESSVQLEDRLSDYTSPVLPHAHMRYSGPPLRFEGSSWIGHPAVTYPTHGYAAYRQPGRLEGAHPDQTNAYGSSPSLYHGNLNAGRIYDPYGHPTGYPSSTIEAARSAHQSSYGPPHSTLMPRFQGPPCTAPVPSPQGYPSPSSHGQPNANLYDYGPPAPNFCGQPSATSYGHGPPTPGSYRQVNGGPYGHSTPSADGSYPPDIQYPSARGAPHGPPRYY